MGLNDTDATHVERSSDRELVVTRTVRGPARIVFEAWANPELFQRWWAPASFQVTIVSYEADVRTGGNYRLVMRHPSMDQPMEFVGRYVEVVPHERIVWTNEEGSGEGPVTTVTFEERGEETLVTVHDLFPSKDDLDEAIASGSTSGWGQQLEQLETLVGELGTSGRG